MDGNTLHSTLDRFFYGDRAKRRRFPEELYHRQFLWSYFHRDHAFEVTSLCCFFASLFSRFLTHPLQYTPPQAKTIFIREVMRLQPSHGSTRAMLFLVGTFYAARHTVFCALIEPHQTFFEPHDGDSIFLTRKCVL